MAKKKLKVKGKKMLAVIRIRGEVDKSKEIKNTLDRLRLRRKNVCVILSESKEIVGMLKKVKDFVTWGEVGEKLISELIEKRGKYPGNKSLKKKVSVNEFLSGKTELKPFFRLHPPRGGHGREGIKVAYWEKGALGPRGKEIEELIRRML